MKQLRGEKLLMKGNICVVIPVHKDQPSINEIISLRQVAKVLKDYTHYLVVSENLEVDAYKTVDPALHIIRLDPSYFRSEESYNTLCRTPAFYEPFLKFKYMLLYQLDCFVFRDELLDWCERGYDYIGAPWLKREHILKRFRKLGLTKLACFLNPVGNGGISLRNVDKFFRISKLLRFVSTSIVFHEDILWCNIAPILCPGFRIPDKATALAFAFEGDPELCLQLNGGKLPFGCHAWEKNGRAFWGKIFKNYGYDVVLE